MAEYRHKRKPTEDANIAIHEQYADTLIISTSSFPQSSQIVFKDALSYCNTFTDKRMENHSDSTTEPAGNTYSTDHTQPIKRINIEVNELSRS